MIWRNSSEVDDGATATKKEREAVVDAFKRKLKPRFYADENFPPLATEILRGSGARVVTAQDTGLCGHPDENHAAFALKEGYVLVSCDRDFLNNERFPLIHCPAIFVFDFGGGSVEEIRLAYRCLRAVFLGPQFYDKWAKIDASRDGWIEQFRYLGGTTSRSRKRIFKGTLQIWLDDPA
jgi:predicted nuclease of predicted toxin-antitoxin system